jgi:ribosomal protein S18 acetylase RimI-like enzyme
MTDAPEPHTVGRHGLGPHVVGQRIVVRHLLPDGRATDVLGTCLSWSDTELVVDREGAGPVTIRVADVVTGKPVPPRASVRHRISAHEVELHVGSLWPAMERVYLGEWVLRHCPAVPPDRARKRANSALVMGDADMPLSHATDAVRSFYEDRGQVPMVQVQLGSSYERWFTSLGWQRVPGGDAHCQLAPVSRALRSSHTLLSALPRRSNDVEEHRTTCDIEEGADRVRVSLDGGTATGEAALDGDWLGIHDVAVDPAHRRQGLATRVLAELLDWGASQGATTACLHVETDNHAGMATYERLGFVTHHTNRYLIG